MEFVDPPLEVRGERGKLWVERVAAMKQNRGEWAKVGNYSPGVATHIRRGEYKAFLPSGEDMDPVQAEVYMKQHWEVTTRKTNDGKRNDVFVRWLG